MKKELIKYSTNLKKAVKKEINNIPLPDFKLKEYLYKAFCHYAPNKERAYIVNSIARYYGFDSKLNYYLESGLEIIFTAYYLRDDLIDNQPKILGETINELTSKKFSMIADILSEIGNSQIAKYCNQLNGLFSEFVFTGFQSLSYGQLLGLDNGYMIGIEDYLKIAYHKNGAMMEYAIKMFQPIFPWKKDLEILIDFAKNFGIASQVRNDIEDFLIDKQIGQPLQDLKNNQANFVLSVHFDRLKKQINLNYNTKSQCEIVSFFSGDLAFAIRFLNELRNLLVEEINSLSNEKCKTELKKIATKLLFIN